MAMPTLGGRYSPDGPNASDQPPGPALRIAMRRGAQVGGPRSSALCAALWALRGAGGGGWAPAEVLADLTGLGADSVAVVADALARAGLVERQGPPRDRWYRLEGGA